MSWPSIAQDRRLKLGTAANTAHANSERLPRVSCFDSMLRSAYDKEISGVWKGLDTNRKPVFIGYDQVEHMIAGLVDAAARWLPDEVVGITRGGLVPAAMAAGILALPLSFVAYDKRENVVGWVGPPATGRRILLVDDCCSTGATLRRVRTQLCDEGRECLTMVVVHDPETVEYEPDLSHPMKELFRLPWERGEATPTGRARRMSGNYLDHAAEAPFFGLGLDRPLLAQMALCKAQRSELVTRQDVPYFPNERTVLISGLQETERMQIVASLASGPYEYLPLECRPDSVACDIASIARLKAETATRWGCTHFVECDAEQALRIAGYAPHLLVTWWSSAERQGRTVTAAAHPEVAFSAP